MNWERARSDEQKEQRIKEIVDATARLYKKYNYGEITFAAIAKEADFTRSNLYKYFDSKEEIFLELLTHDALQWKNDIIQSFSTDVEYSIDSFAEIWKNVLVRYNRLLSLFPLSGTMFEKNCSDAALIKYKRILMGIIEELVEFLKIILPDYSEEQITDFLSLQIAVASGLYPVSTALSDKQKKVLQKAGIEYPHVDFDQYFKTSLVVLLRGLNE